MGRTPLLLVTLVACAKPGPPPTSVGTPGTATSESDGAPGWWCDLDIATPPCIRDMEECNALAEGTCSWREDAYCFDYVVGSGYDEQYCLASAEACATQEEFDAHAYTITTSCRAL